ncbi:hypothetical protein AB0M87_04795 [Streptomyces sp. NPDC051320]|uniref:hypothetical protein n=1 Tax=Streptomyces sp. NPDC051320 TaxID=3154644 RepID=UPI003435EE89
MEFASLAARRPIAGSEQDQLTPDGTDNPLWDVVRWMPATPYIGEEYELEPFIAATEFDISTAQRLSKLGAELSPLCKRYAWSIISPGDVAWMSNVLGGRMVVEIGAGSGYWAWQLEQAGIDVAAYDPNPVGENTYCTSGPSTTVLRDDASAVKHHQDRALLMVWPPFQGESARHALSSYEGDLLIYAGESYGGCTADDDFYELLAAEWDEIGTSPQHVTWWGIRCRLSAYQRRSRSTS